MQKRQKVLHSLDKYVAIGFDADHCLVRHKLPELMSIGYQLIARFLVDEKSYPEEILEFGNREMAFIMNGLVVDANTGYILKLGKDKKILRAYYGFERVAQAELELKYGSPPRLDAFDPHNCNTNDYKCLLTFNECFLFPVLAHMIAYKIKSQTEINIREILKDAEQAWRHAGAKYVKGISQMRERILYQQDKMKEQLKALRAKGKILFIASNGPAPYLSSVMKYAYGEDWQTLFDFIVSAAGKPNFFESQETAFYDAETNLPVDKLERHKMYTGGNAKLLEENFQEILQGKTGRVLFAGDQYSTDVLAAEKIEHWDGVCIMEELGSEVCLFGDNFDDTYWGHWKHDETSSGKVSTFWYDYMAENVAACVPLLDSKEMVSFFEMSEDQDKSVCMVNDRINTEICYVISS